jgi:excisionase family DNA binding protein
MTKKTAPQRLDRDWMSVQQAAAYLQVCTMTIHRYIREGRLQSSQIIPGGKRRIASSSIEKLLQR